jgi:hypothetical protein
VKITKSQLRQLIKEEVQSLNESDMTDAERTKSSMSALRRDHEKLATPSELEKQWKEAVAAGVTIPKHQWITQRKKFHDDAAFSANAEAVGAAGGTP